MKLALNGNLDHLLPLAQGSAIKVCTLEGHEPSGLAHSIISKRCGAAFLGYMQQQRERMIGTRGQMNVTRPELISGTGMTPVRRPSCSTRLPGHRGDAVGRPSASDEVGRAAACVIDVRTGDHVSKRFCVLSSTSSTFEDAILDSGCPNGRIRAS